MLYIFILQLARVNVNIFRQIVVICSFNQKSPEIPGKGRFLVLKLLQNQ